MGKSKTRQMDQKYINKFCIVQGIKFGEAFYKEEILESVFQPSILCKKVVYNLVDGGNVIKIFTILYYAGIGEIWIF